MFSENYLLKPDAQASLSLQTNAFTPTHYFFYADEMAALFKSRCQHFIEVREESPMGESLDFIRREYPHYSLSLTTRTAFNQPIAELFTRHLATKRPLSDMLISDIQTCLHEALLNATIHGNLAVRCEYTEIGGFQHYLDSVSARMEDPARYLKRVDVFVWMTREHLTICVADQGDGFTLAQPEISIDQPHGRGLNFIHALSSNVWQTRSNTIYMQFRCTD